MLLTLYLLTSFVYFRLCGLLLIEEDDITNNDDVNKHADIAAASFGQNCCGSVSLGKRSRFKFHKEYSFLKISNISGLVELQSTCLCAVNTQQQLSIQCNLVNFPMLASALGDYARDVPIDLVYVNNSAIVELPENVFRSLKISNLQLNNGKISKISPDAFRGLEDTLQGVNLADNDLSEVPVETLRTLRLLNSLDLTNNKIQYVPNNAFVTIRLKTLKLSDNNLTIADGAFSGLEQSLKNLNLKGCSLKEVPKALSSLAGLAFLDLAQNSIRELGDGLLSDLSSLTALNLERNVIQTLHPAVFYGVNDTLSSLSLLNNLLTSYPTQAITSLSELRVSRNNFKFAFSFLSIVSIITSVMKKGSGII